MTLAIDHIAITLQGVSPELGERASGLLADALTRRLSSLKLATAGAGLAHADLGVIDAPAKVDAPALAEMIAARLADWVSHEHGAKSGSTDAATTAEGR
ncbi:MAG TPA: hypothetical protein VGM74_03940 [Burkholderiaceae bacterium]|jgi:hypothetical protein